MGVDRSRFDRILVPLDGSPLSEQAVPYAQRIARSGSEVVLLRVTAPEATYDLHRRPVVAVDGDPSEEILRAASDLGVGLIVMASEGNNTTGVGGLTSAADRVARTAPVPVLVVRDRAATAGDITSPIRRLVVPLDGSDRAAQALVVAEDLSPRLRVPVFVLTVVDVAATGPPARRHDLAGVQLDAQRTLDRATSRLLLRRIGVDARLLDGPAAATIIGATGPGDLVVMTSRGRGGARRPPLGSVAEEMIGSGSVPVLLLPSARTPEVVVSVVTGISPREPIAAT